MWQFFHNKILFVDEGSDRFAWEIFSPKKGVFSGEICRVPTPNRGWQGYDDWVQHHLQEDELSLVRGMIQKAQHNPGYRGHLQGISLAESVKILQNYYRDCGYEDVLAKNYILPDTVQVTTSISLRHALWCEKDKRFLHTEDINKIPYGMTTPPIRGSHDLRILQQALRMNCIMGIEVFPGDEQYINMLVSAEILPPFSVSQMIQFRWQRWMSQ